MINKPFSNLAPERARSVASTSKQEATKFWHNFKEFAFQGNVLDLAIGVIIGAAFNKIVQSLTSDIIMPIFGRILGNMAFSELYLNLGHQYLQQFGSGSCRWRPSY